MRYSTLALLLMLSGCVTMSGVYTVSAYDKNGQLLGKDSYMAEGSGIYTLTNALCANFPGATVVIKDAKTGEELKTESPHRCK